MARQAGSHGFWRGVLAGLLVAAAGLLALALAYPPEPLRQPEITPGSTLPPAAPAAPADLPQPPRNETGSGLLPAAPSAPLIEGVPTPDPAPSAPAGAAGSPSLVPSSQP